MIHLSVSLIQSLHRAGPYTRHSTYSSWFNPLNVSVKELLNHPYFVREDPKTQRSWVTYSVWQLEVYMLITRILALPAETSQIPDLHLQHSTSYPHLDILHMSHNLMLKIQFIIFPTICHSSVFYPGQWHRYIPDHSSQETRSHLSLFTCSFHPCTVTQPFSPHLPAHLHFL